MRLLIIKYSASVRAAICRIGASVAGISIISIAGAVLTVSVRIAVIDVHTTATLIGGVNSRTAILVIILVGGGDGGVVLVISAVIRIGGIGVIS